METDISISGQQPPALIPTLSHRTFLLGHSEHEAEMKQKRKQHRERKNELETKTTASQHSPFPALPRHTPLAFSITLSFPQGQAG